MKFGRGLVVGKFSPLHRGHELVLRCALDRCDEVVAITYSNPEFPGCEPEKREQWLAELFPSVRRLIVTDSALLRAGIPNTPRIPANEAPDAEHRAFVGFLCRHFLKATVDAVFTSELYGDGFARELSDYFRAHMDHCEPVHHVLVDLQRSEAPVSGTALRSNPDEAWKWLSPVVRRSFVKRICFLGGESTGKSTLSAELARHTNGICVPEYGRELWEARNGNLAYEDLLHIAEVQVEREEQAVSEARRYVFCDTSPLTTLFYSQHLFGKADARLYKLADRSYDLVALCAPDFPFMQDGTRQPPEFREMQHLWYLEQLSRRGIPYLTVSGSVKERIAQIRRKI